MKWLAVAIPVLLIPALASAESTSGSLQALIQAGSVGEVSESLGEPVATIDGIWSSSRIFGWWGEFGVLQRPGVRGHTALSGSGSREVDGNQVIELSTGFIVGAPVSGAYPYFRAGIGAYHDNVLLDDPYVQPLALPWTGINPHRYEAQGWMPGMSVGIGVRLNLTAPVPAPNIEARLHVTGVDYGSPLLAVTGGFWFR